MLRMRAWRRSNAARAVVVVLIGILVVPMVQACPMPMADVSMAYANADMPDPCAGLAKAACLFSYIQADRATGNDSAKIAVHSASILRVVPVVVVALAVRYSASDEPSVHSGAPPPRLLFCRMQE